MRSALLLSLLGVCGSAALQGQTSLPCGQSFVCSQGSSFSFDLGQGFDQIVSIIQGIPDFSFTYSFSVSGGTLPPGLTLSPSGLLSGTLTQAGNFSFTLSLTEVLIYMGQTVLNQSFPIPLEIVVTGYTGPQVTVDPTGLNFNLTQGGAAVTQSVTVSNHGSQSAQFSASASTNSGANWLKVSSASGSAPSFASSTLSITADPSRLTPGTYSGTVTISIPGGQTFSISVLAVVMGSQPSLQLSQTGERFEAVSGGTATPPQKITVLNSGAGTLNFSAAAATVSGGNWLVVSPSSGSSTASSSGSVTVSVNPAGLATGDYYGTISFSATGAANSPQVATIVLNVVSPANSPGAMVAPTGLIFVGTAGGSNPAAKTLSITNPSPNALTYLLTPFANGSNGSPAASNWLTASPNSASVTANQPATVSVQPSLQGLAPGVYTGDVSITIASSGSAAASPQNVHVAILLLVLPAGVSLPGQVVRPSAVHPDATACSPTRLLPVFTMLGTGFTTAVAWPTAIEVTVVDDCGNPLVAGSVTATFSNGDPALSLDSLSDGRWTATWNATHSSAGVTVTAQAQEIQPALNGMASIGGMLQPNNTTPLVTTGGVVNAAYFVGNQPLAPGAYASIYGSNFSQSTNPIFSTQLPFKNQLGGTSVILAGRQLPLQFTSTGQINVVVPYDIPVNSTQQLVVQNGSAISIPQSVVIASASPAVFTQGPANAAAINVFKPDGTPLANSSPVGAGYVIVLYCSGLGAVNPAVTAGTAAPSPPAQTVNPVTATIGGMNATVLFAGLAPSFANLYQVNVLIPTGLPSGSATVTLTVNQQQSAPVSILIQ